MIDFKRYVKRWKGAETVSVASSMQQMGDLTDTLEAAMECYGGTIESIGEYSPASPKALRESHVREMKRLKATLLAVSTRQNTEETRRQLDEQLKSYGKALEQHIQQQERDAKEVLSMVAQITESIASQEKQYNVRFKGIAKKLRLLTTAQDLSEIRQKLSEEVGQLERYVEDMARDTKVALDRVTTDLLSLHSQVQNEAWLQDGKDAVTQLPGRPEGQRAMESRIRMDTPFCVARFAIDRAAELGRRHRKDVWGSVLAEFAGRLKTEFPVATIVRWAEGEFLVISDASLLELATQVSAAEARFGGAYTVPARKERIVVACSSAAVQWFRGETIPQLMARLEEQKCSAE